jgi:hypothetical protein
MDGSMGGLTYSIHPNGDWVPGFAAADPLKR